jgi:hypothetical protein
MLANSSLWRFTTSWTPSSSGDCPATAIPAKRAESTTKPPGSCDGAGQHGGLAAALALMFLHLGATPYLILRFAAVLAWRHRRAPVRQTPEQRQPRGPESAGLSKRRRRRGRLMLAGWQPARRSSQPQRSVARRVHTHVGRSLHPRRRGLIATRPKSRAQRDAAPPAHAVPSPTISSHR